MSKFISFTVVLFLGIFLLSSCEQLSLGFMDEETIVHSQEQAEPDADAKYKYVPAEENKIDGQYIVLFSESFLPAGAVKNPSTGTRVENSRIAERNHKEASEKIYAFLKNKGIRAERILAVYTEALSGFAAKLDQTEVEELLVDPNILAIEEDRMVTISAEAGASETSFNNAGQYVPCGITRHGGFRNNTNPDKFIWILDTGIAPHSDLNIVREYSATFVGGNWGDCHGHGTHVAGIAAAKNNSFGVVGMSAGAPVVSVRVLGGPCGQSAQGSTSQILRGVDYVARYDERGDVMNMSLGGYVGASCGSYNSSYRIALTNIGNGGTWVILAAGNRRPNASVADNAALIEPACINGTRILTVANMDCYNRWNFGSNYGIPPIDWIAVGTDVVSTYLNNNYNSLSGTSMAAPMVAGIVHARGSAPRRCGSVTIGGVSYPVACR